MSPNDMSKNIVSLLLLNDHTHLSAKLILPPPPPLLNLLRDGPAYIATYVNKDLCERCENYDTENNWDNHCQKRKINTTYYPDYDKEPEKDPDLRLVKLIRCKMGELLRILKIYLNINDYENSICRNP